MSVSNSCLSHCALEGSGLRRVGGRDVAQSRVALPYPFPPALVALTLTCAPSDRAPWISAKSISLFRRNSPISFLPAHTSCEVSLFGAEVHRKNRLLVRPSGRTAAEDRLTSDQPRPIVNRSREAASATPRGLCAIGPIEDDVLSVSPRPWPPRSRFVSTKLERSRAATINRLKKPMGVAPHERLLASGRGGSCW